MKSNIHYIIVSDTETSGLPTKGGKGKPELKAFYDILVCELAAVVIDIWDMKIVEEYDVLIKPYNETYTWQAAAEQTHGISQKVLMEQGVEIKEVYKSFASLLSKYKNPRIGAVLAGHNFQNFDIPFIEGIFEFNKDDLWKYVGFVEDTMKMAYYSAPEQENFKLGTCCRLNNIDLVDAHRALTDTRANALLMLKYIEKLRGIGVQANKAGSNRIQSRFRQKFQLV